LLWQQPFAGAPGVIWIYAPEADWNRGSNELLKAAGIDDADPPTLKSTWLEILGQGLSGLAQDFTARLDREVTCAAGTESAGSVPPSAARYAIRFEGEPGTVSEIVVSLETALLDAFIQAEIAAAPPAPVIGAAVAAGAGSGSAVPASKTFDLLLDVELPVSISFGRAQVPLKDVIKLTTGAIVELNRSINEPVEVIVNNCVIARGEVVVVEGNFGVRIHEVISRQERLRTLN
jgi:flagellar motor switch protein FliN/FliY